MKRFYCNGKKDYCDKEASASGRIKCDGCEHFDESGGYVVDESEAKAADLEAPTADKVEVVRCKDCKYVHYNTSSESYSCQRRGYFSEGVEENDFCSRGERREG